MMVHGYVEQMPKMTPESDGSPMVEGSAAAYTAFEARDELRRISEGMQIRLGQLEKQATLHQLQIKQVNEEKEALMMMLKTVESAVQGVNVR